MKETCFRANIDNMQCADCENVIEEAVLALPGIQTVKADFSSEQVNVAFDPSVISGETICAAIKKVGYNCKAFKQKKTQGFLKRFGIVMLALCGIAALLQLESLFSVDVSTEDLLENFSYGLLFLVGVFTSFHCIGMCGGFVIGYCTDTRASGSPSILRHLSYGVGKILSYSFFGAIFGLFGQFITITLGMKTLAAGLAGSFLIIYGLSMLETFAPLRRLHLRLPRFFTRRLSTKKRQLSSPLAIGLLNGLMIACGPLQAMYIFAAGTGSALQGAKILAVFALGTLPMMFVFGYLTSLITGTTTRRLLKLSALIIIALGATMLNRSLLMSGNGYDFKSLTHRLEMQWQTHFVHAENQAAENKVADYSSVQQQGYQVVYMEIDGDGYMPDEFVIKKGILLKWLIHVKELTPCNRQLLVPSENISLDLQEGLQMLEFMPEQTGIINWSCQMGMMSGRFQVKD